MVDFVSILTAATRTISVRIIDENLHTRFCALIIIVKMVKLRPLKCLLKVA